MLESQERVLDNAEERWAKLGPYYAMFPVTFAHETVERFCSFGGSVLDPFCGRGTVPFVAKIRGRQSVGIDVNPVAYVFSKAKADPEPDSRKLVNRVGEVARAVTAKDTKAENEFQKWAWSTEVLGFLQAARRLLDWHNDRVDRTLMAIILVHLHGKLGNAVSNQMRQSKAMAPEYSVKWWKERRMAPPAIEPVDYFQRKIEWRYRHGVVGGAAASIFLGDAQEVLPRISGQFDMLFTSPPYAGVTNYRLDNWIRLWMLGASSLPQGGAREKYGNRKEYASLIGGVFNAAKPLMRADCVLYVRTDTREFTRDTTIKALKEVWPDHNFFWRAERYGWSQTKLFGDQGQKPGETDLLGLVGTNTPLGFQSCR